MIWEDLNWIREYRFPITSTDTSYEEITTQWGSEYINKLRQCVYIPANEADKIRTHIDNLLQSVHLFLSGNPYTAYEYFCAAMDLVEEHLQYSEIGAHPRLVGCRVPYYRVLKLDSKPFDYKEMLHIPYNLRNIIPAYRFSMPGIPCTYMSTSPEVAWCEAGMPDEYQLAEYSASDSSGKLLALDINLQEAYFSICSNAEVKSQDSHLDVWKELSQTIYSLPIIAFCSVVKKHDNAKFNEEYIIPQMLMTWISANTNLLGIRYRTSKRYELGYNISAYNVALLAAREDADHYQRDLLARLRTDYVHEQQERYRTQLAQLGDAIDHASASERVKLTKQQKKFQDQATELQKYEEKVHHLADQNIEIDLDDGVKHNYELFADVLAKIK